LNGINSIFIENFKGNTIKEILEVAIDRFDVCINSIVIVFSEVLFKLMVLKSGKSILTIKSQNLISSLIKELKNYSELLLLFKVLEENKEILNISLRFLEKYSLLTNDALILATCKYYGIDKIASLDSDFEKATISENIKLIRSVNDLK